MSGKLWSNFFVLTWTKVGPKLSSRRDTDAEMLAFVEQSPCLFTTKEERTKELSQNLLGKYVDGRAAPDQIFALQHARKMGIRVPAVRRFVFFDDTLFPSAIITMEPIHGHTLEHLWPEIGWWKTTRMALQLRRFAQFMRTDTSTTTGGLASGFIRSPYLDGIYAPAPHSSPAAFTGYISWWLINCRPTTSQTTSRSFPQPWREHVFVHQDLVGRNIVVDARDQLWIVDWGFSGYYPIYMEYMDMLSPFIPWSYNSWMGRLARWWWAFLRFIVLGPSGPYQRAHHAMGRGVQSIMQISA
jgi:Phosphotransferase enzyme family